MINDKVNKFIKDNWVILLPLTLWAGSMLYLHSTYKPKPSTETIFPITSTVYGLDEDSDGKLDYKITLGLSRTFGYVKLKSKPSDSLQEAYQKWLKEKNE